MTREEQIKKLAEVTSESEAALWYRGNIKTNESNPHLRERIGDAAADAFLAGIHHARTQAAAEIADLKWFAEQINQYVMPGDRDTKDAALHAFKTIREEISEYREVLEKISDPRKRDHKEPDAYTQLGCVMNMATDILARYPKEK